MKPSCAFRIRTAFRPDVNLALALLEIPGRTDEAVAHLEAALRLQPGNESARAILARLR